MNTLEGALPMTIYTVLKGEHEEVRGLLNALQASPDALEEGKEAIFYKLYRELLSHAKAEQATVYPRAAEKMLQEEIDKAEAEHAEIERLLESIKLSIDAPFQTWEQQLQALKDKVEQHVREEEDEMFKKMERAFTDEEAKDMAKHFYEAKKRHMEVLEKE